MARISFNADEHQGVGEFKPLPAGDYITAITASEMKDTKDGDGKYLELVFDVLDGEHKGRKVFDRLTWVNKNQTAVDIGKGKLATICKAVGIPFAEDSSELHDLPLVITIGHREYQGKLYEDVKGYKSKRQAVSAPVAGDQGDAPPWQR